MDDGKSVEDTLAAPPPGESGEHLVRGAAVARYIIIEKLGAGGMGVVYSAYDPELNRRVAVKLVRYAQAPGADSLGRSRLLREAQAIARVSHPNVVAVYDVGTYRDHVFIAMELVDGDTLTEWLHARARTVAEILEAFTQAGRGLDAAHAAGLVHRDFKPDNVLVGRDGRVRVADFGLVRTDEEHTPERVRPAIESGPDALATPLTMEGAFIGTPAYMAPEQFRFAPVDARSDQFSFCVALWEALFGQRPFAGTDVATLSGEVLANRLRPPASRRGIPPHVRALLLRGLRGDPGDRFVSMAALLAELGRDPALARRRAGWVLAAVVLVAAGVGAQRLAQRRRAGLCSGARERIAQVWSGRQREEMGAAFAATGAPYAGDALRSAAEVLDRYADEWAAARTGACEATHVRGEQSEERLDQRMACLDDREEELRTLVDLFAHADRALVGRAQSAARALGPVADCSAAALAREGPRPPAAAARAAVDALNKELARVKGQLDAGKYAEGRKQIAPLMPRVAAVHYRPLEAEALLLEGRLEDDDGEPAAALATLEKAWLAAQAGGADEIASRALTELAVASDYSGQSDRGLAWARQAEATVERIGNPPLRRAALENVLGDLLQSRGDYAQSAEHYRRALDLLAPGSAQQQAAVHNNLSLAYEGQGNLVGALAETQKARDIFERELGPKHPQTAIALNNVGYFQMQLGRPEARATVTNALERAEAALGPEHPMLALSLTNLCDLAREAHHFDEAEAFGQRALAVRQKAFGPEHPEVAATLTSLGVVAYARGNLPQAEERLQRSLAMREKLLGPHHPYVIETLTALGETELDEGHVAAALTHLGRAAQDLAAPRQRADRLWVQFLVARAGRDRAAIRAAAEAARAALAAEAGRHDEEMAILDRYR